jgi:hypothetical protein
MVFLGRGPGVSLADSLDPRLVAGIPPACFVALCLIAGFAVAAVFFSARERKAGQTGRSVGFFSFAVVIIIVAALILLTFVL